nr:hypothetical protein Itr_chr12CG01480 [Ipomoea trifida]
MGGGFGHKFVCRGNRRFPLCIAITIHKGEGDDDEEMKRLAMASSQRESNAVGTLTACFCIKCMATFYANSFCYPHLMPPLGLSFLPSSQLPHPTPPYSPPTFHFTFLIFCPLTLSLSIPPISARTLLLME